MNEPSFGEMMKNKVMTGQQLRCMYQIKWKKYIILNVIFLTIFIFDILQTLYTCTNQAQQRRNTGNI